MPFKVCHEIHFYILAKVKMPPQSFAKIGGVGITWRLLTHYKLSKVGRNPLPIHVDVIKHMSFLETLSKTLCRPFFLESQVDTTIYALINVFEHRVQFGLDWWWCWWWEHSWFTKLGFQAFLGSSSSCSLNLSRFITHSLAECTN